MIEFDTDLSDLNLSPAAAAELERVILARAAMLRSGGVATDTTVTRMALRAIAGASEQPFGVMLYHYEDPAGPVCVVAALSDATADRRPG